MTASSRTLRQRIHDHFDLSDLHTLCFDLRIDYEDFGERLGKRDFILCLIQYVRENNRWPELLQLLRRERAPVRWPDELPPYDALYTPEDKIAYLNLMQKLYGTLHLPVGETAVALERIYVSLKADAMNATEREAEHRFLMADVERVYQLRRQVREAYDEYIFYDHVRQAIKRNPRSRMYEARHWEMLFGERQQEILSLAEVVQRHEHVVILGDPGSGKTTLCWWLALQFAQAMVAGETAVVARADQVRPSDEAGQQVDFGPVRLPIVIRIGEYAQARFPTPGEDNHLTLTQYIMRGQHYTADLLKNNGLAPERVGELAQEYLWQGRALVVLDGLDEVGDPGERRRVMEAVETFMQTQGENKLLLTSRIVGYQFKPLTHLPHYTVEAMDETAIKAFCHAWVQHVAQEEELEQAAQGLEDAVFNAHPGVQVMAGNPLLLTILAQVYWQRPNRDLPTRRVELFDEAEEAFYDQRQAYWKEAGVSPEALSRALGAVAIDLHSHEATGFASEREVKQALQRALPHAMQVKAVLAAAKNISGFLIARGEGVYGFLHRGLQEYFAARYLVKHSGDVRQALAPYILDPTWREPIVLAIGMVSRRHIRGLFDYILRLDDVAGAYLPRRELLLAAACDECWRVPSESAKAIGKRLLAFYADREGRGKSPIMRNRLERAFAQLKGGPAKHDVEQVLCDGITSPNFEWRYAAVSLVLGAEWYTRPIAGALVVAWQTYAAPAGTMLDALHKLSAQDGDLFAGVAGLSMRAMMVKNHELWQRVEQNKSWQAIIRALYLSIDADFAPEQIHRDTPLTEKLLGYLQAKEDIDLIGALKAEFSPLLDGEDAILARDAAICLAALGDGTWLPTYVASVKGDDANQSHREQRAVLVSLFYLSILARVRTLDLAHDRTHVRDLECTLARDLALGHVRVRDLERTLARAFARTRVRTLDLALDLTRDLVLVRDLVLTSDPDLDLDLDLDEVAYAVQVAKERWVDDPEILAALQEVESQIVSWRTFLNNLGSLQPIVQVTQELFQNLAKRLPPRTTTPTASSQWVFSLTPDGLSVLVLALQKVDDDQRQAARNVLFPTAPYLASKVGRETIEKIAQLSQEYETDYQVGTQLGWALRRIQYDEVTWVLEWITAANQDEKHVSHTILNGMHQQSASVLKTTLNLYPKAHPATQRALLHALSWLGRWKQQTEIPPELLETAVDHYLTWLLVTEDEATQQQLIKVLGYWPIARSHIQITLQNILSQPGVSANIQTAIYDALVHQAGGDNYQALAFLQASLSVPAARVAWVRVQVTEMANTINKIEQITQQLVEKLTEAFPDSPADRWQTLWQAGVDDDIWHDAYHLIIAQSGRLFLSQHPKLLPHLLNQYTHALVQDSWEERRILLAILATCLETMPQTIQNLCDEQGLNLEQLLIQGTKDYSHDCRRFALVGLSYLRRVTPAIVPVLVTALQENVDIVQKDALEAVRRFQSINEGVINELGQYLTGGSIQTAHGVSQMLTSLGVMAAGEDSTLRQQIIGLLVEALSDEGCQREYEEGKRLEDAFYDALFQVAGLPA